MLRACDDTPGPNPEVFAGVLAVANSFKANKETPAKARETLIKRRRLKYAEREVDFFFMWRMEMWINVGPLGLAEPEKMCQHFFVIFCYTEVAC